MIMSGQVGSGQGQVGQLLQSFIYIEMTWAHNKSNIIVVEFLVKQKNNNSDNNKDFLSNFQKNYFFKWIKLHKSM
jgi:hypothetical protein